MKKMLQLISIATFGITMMAACNGGSASKEGEKLALAKANDSSATYNESSTYNKVIDSNYAKACIKAYDSIYDVKNICKNEKAIAKAFSKSISFPRHDDSTDIASWIANLAKNPATKDYDGIRVRLGVYVKPDVGVFKLKQEVIDKITALDAKGNSKVGRLTAFLWAYKTKKTSNLKAALADPVDNEEDLGEPLNLGDLKP